MLSKKDQAIKETMQRPNVIKTFFKHVEMVDDCHIWKGQIDHRGYGSFTVYSRTLGHKVTVKAHRFVYANKYGFDKLPQGITSTPKFVINHLCHNKPCVNPGHLEVITRESNVSREKRKPKDGAA